MVGDMVAMVWPALAAAAALAMAAKVPAGVLRASGAGEGAGVIALEPPHHIF